MNRWVARALIGVVLVLGAQAAVRSQPSILGVGCVVDGNHPKWVLEAQNYPEGQDCVYELPWFLAPPWADWTTYCTMWCEPIWPPSD